MPSRDRTAVYPDHPLLVRGPDVLADINGELVAYFAHTGSGPRPGSHAERARMLLSRLALPGRTTFVLLATSTKVLLDDDDLDLFDAIQYGVKSARSSARRWEVIGNDLAALVNGVRPFHLERFADAWSPRRQSRKRRQTGYPSRGCGRTRGHHLVTALMRRMAGYFPRARDEPIVHRLRAGQQLWFRPQSSLTTPHRQAPLSRRRTPSKLAMPFCLCTRQVHPSRARQRRMTSSSLTARLRSQAFALIWRRGRVDNATASRHSPSTCKQPPDAHGISKAPCDYR